MSCTAEQVMRQLRGVVEPCSLAMRNPTNIADMGLVDAIEIEDGQVRVTLCLTDPACIHYAGMKRYIRDALMALEGVRSVEVRQTLDKLWTPDRVRALPLTSAGADSGVTPAKAGVQSVRLDTGVRRYDGIEGTGPC